MADRFDAGRAAGLAVVQRRIEVQDELAERMRDDRRERAATEGLLNYSVPSVRRERLHIDRLKQTVTERPMLCAVENGWSIADSLSLDRQGFIAVKHKTRFGDVRAREPLMAGYPDEMLDLIRELSGTPWVVPKRFDVVVRTFAKVTDGSREPVGAIVHSDYSPASVKAQADWVLSVNGQAGRPYRRVAVYQTWRALSPAPQERPLALCDGRTIRAEDRVLVDNVIGAEDDPAKVFESTIALHNPDHRWFYFPDMLQDDLLIFRGADTEPSTASNIFHTSFEDPGAGDRAITRESVESRFYCFYE